MVPVSIRSISAALALLAVLAAGFGAEAARAEGSIWDKVIKISDPIFDIAAHTTDGISFTATGDGYIVTSLDFIDDHRNDINVISANGLKTTLDVNYFKGEYHGSVVTIPVSKGDIVQFTAGDLSTTYYVPSGGAAVDDGVRLMFFYLVTDTIILRSEQGVQPLLVSVVII